jgi:hypothetical protein
MRVERVPWHLFMCLSCVYSFHMSLGNSASVPGGQLSVMAVSAHVLFLTFFMKLCDIFFFLWPENRNWRMVVIGMRFC